VELPRLYAIIDAGQVRGSPAEFARELIAGGVRLLQYRNKEGSSRRLLSDARELRRQLGPEARLIMNDRSDLAMAAELDGVHLGLEDISVAGARRLCPRPKIIGVSTHDLDQVRAANGGDADYIAFGPVFPTRSKQDPDPTVGLSGLRAARSLTPKPLVAIGGITRENCRSVIDAGADSVAVIADLLSHPRESSRAFLQVLL
jgi:thiamine-phosphate pyrophosphorylase